LAQVRADFYAMVTHDLRNPTTLIILASSMLTDGSVEPLTPRQLEFVSMINEAADRLLRLINDYLDFAAIDAGYLRLDRSEVDLREVVESSAHFVRLQTQVKRQTLTLDMPADAVRVWADAERLKQVLDNLFSNAIKYTPVGGHIALRLRVEGEQAIFRVSDTGIGVSPDQLPALFAKYHRLSGDATRGILGTGLGLVIVKEIVEAHGGSIRAESEGVPGKGASFTFNIPLSQAAEPAAVALPLALNGARDLMGAEDADLFQTFWEESQRHLRLLRGIFGQLRDTPQDPQLIETAQRASHTLRGNAGAMRFFLIRDLAAQIDDALRQANRGARALTPVDVANLTHLLDEIDLALDGDKDSA
jgi:HPt (histidine-containing phosphotransfer) domain-containing protein/two-component sensor histidine kinase